MPDQGRDNLRSECGSTVSRRSLAIWIWSALFIADAVLVTRRVSGEFARPLPGGLALLSTALVALASWAAWRLFSSSKVNSRLSQRRDWESRGLSLAATVLWSWSISAGATPQAAGLLFAVVAIQIWGLLALDLGETFLPGSPTVIEPALTNESAGPCPVKISVAEVRAPILTDEPVDFELPDLGDELGSDIGHDADGSLTLWLSRRQTDEGEQIEGWVRVQFAAGQRETTIHVAFCPPMSGSPDIETEELDGADLEIRVAAVFPFGVRLSVRRSGALDERNSDRIGFIAQALSAQRAA